MKKVVTTTHFMAMFISGNVVRLRVCPSARRSRVVRGVWHVFVLQCFVRLLGSVRCPRLCRVCACVLCVLLVCWLLRARVCCDCPAAGESFGVHVCVRSTRHTRNPPPVS